MKNKKFLSETTDSRTYRILTTIDQDPYPFSEECWSRHSRRTKKSKAGSKNRFNWKIFRKELFKFQYRTYRTWKHNRKTQWKEK